MDHLETLQKELDKVLEQVGKVLAANNEKGVMAAGAKLKHVLPGAQENFHQALDHMSEEIEHARLVMRRDLAVRMLPKPEPEKIKSPDPSPAAVKEPTPAPAEEAPAAETRPSKAAEETPVADAKPPSPADKSASPSAPLPPPTDKPAPTPPKDLNNEGESDQQPPGQPENNNGTDNDNISALLPGLQDYANDSTGGGGTADDIDFDDIFGDAGAAADMGGAQPGDGGLGDFMDFDFDAEFGASGGGDGGGGEFGTGTGNGSGVDDVDFFKFD